MTIDIVPVTALILLILYAICFAAGINRKITYTLALSSMFLNYFYAIKTDNPHTVILAAIIAFYITYIIIRHGEEKEKNNKEK